MWLEAWRKNVFLWRWGIYYVLRCFEALCSYPWIFLPIYVSVVLLATPLSFLPRYAVSMSPS
jgi:hypothetical protein